MIWALTGVNVALTIACAVMLWQTRKTSQEMKWVLGNALNVMKKILKRMKRS